MSYKNIYEPMITDKDKLIAQLKAQVFEYEQSDKNYMLLNQKYRSLQNEFSLISEEKMKQEYDYTQRVEFANKQIIELKNLAENIQEELNDKLSTNKKLFVDNTNFYKTIEQKNGEIHYLQDQLDMLAQDNDRLQRERDSADENACTIHGAKLKVENQLASFIQENKKLNELVYEQREELKRIEHDKTSLINKLEDQKFEIDSLAKKNKTKDENIFYLSQQLDQMNEDFMKQASKLKENEDQINKLNNENIAITSQLNNQKNLVSELEKRLDLIENYSKEKDKEIAILKNEISIEIHNFDVLNAEKNRILGERERFKNQLAILMETNSVLEEEMKILVDRDEKVRIQLEKRAKTKNVMDENRRVLEQSYIELQNSCYPVETEGNYRYERNSPKNENRSYNNTGFGNTGFNQFVSSRDYNQLRKEREANSRSKSKEKYYKQEKSELNDIKEKDNLNNQTLNTNEFGKN